MLSKTGRILAGKALNQLHKEDIFIANSKWTAKLSHPYTTTKPIVITPPVHQEFEMVPWALRLELFISFGRISPEKKIEDTITILEGVRKNGIDIGLTVFGKFGDDDYSKTIQNRITAREWMTAPGSIYGDKLGETLRLFRYGINTCRREAFGISTAEMIKAEIIPFVAIQGAQSEIVNNENLVFRDIEDAIIKIIAVLKSDKLRIDIMENIKNRHDFSTLKFKNDILVLFKNL
jgi:glycosyltransferase involved in cell wall biosynthesis